MYALVMLWKMLGPRLPNVAVVGGDEISRRIRRIGYHRRALLLVAETRRRQRHWHCSLGHDKRVDDECLMK